MKLTKKEKEFLINWLSDDLDLALRNEENYSIDLISNLKKILKKVKGE